jgi:hypothetical protein
LINRHANFVRELRIRGHVVSIYSGNTRLQTTWFNVYNRASFLAEHGGYWCGYQATLWDCDRLFFATLGRINAYVFQPNPHLSMAQVLLTFLILLQV